MFLQQRAQIFFVEGDILKTVLKPGTSSRTGIEIALQVWGEARRSLLISLADV